MILICDDDKTVQSSLTLVLRRAGYKVMNASTPQEAINLIRTTPPRLILMDMNYTHTTTGEEGLQLLAQVKVLLPEVPVILITAWGSIGLAVQGIRAGAFDFITKPWNNLVLINSIRTALEIMEQGIKEEADKTASHVNRFEKIIGRSPLLQQALDTVARIAPTQAPVLITGESGTGKELIAEAIHTLSNRKEAPFVKVNLGGIPQSLFESEMFGHKKGAFTDAAYDRTGRFELADKGSIFLDEIGELDPVCQVKLLRVLQEQTFEPVGESRPRQIDTRFISATNRDLPALVRQGTFREDLFYRINLITIHIPALRERREDIPLLAGHFARQLGQLNQTAPVEFSGEAISFLRQLPYPGNIRELKNLIDRTILVTGKPVVTDSDLKVNYIELPQGEEEPAGIQSLETIEKQMIRKAIRLYGNNHTRIATALGLTRQALYRRLEKYEISLP
ncbi:MAG: sigma-54 dependent transcriptional regulator [Tannerellaceae bacterium]|nr:sigma-54 dependent transcriptional regulator [Tannerellaceae bacterium]